MAHSLDTALAVCARERERGGRKGRAAVESARVARAAGAASEDAFKLYLEMRERRLPLEPQVFSALLSAYSAEVRATSSSDRRQQLVHMERAFHLLDDMQARVPPLLFWTKVTQMKKPPRLQAG